MIARFLSGLLAIAAVPAAALASPHPTGGLDALATVAFALHNAPSILAQRATVANLDLTYTRDRANEFPTLGAQLQNQLQKSSNVSGNLAQFGLSPSSNFSQNTAQLQASYNIYNGTGQLTAEQALRQRRAAQFELLRVGEQLAIAVSNNFYTLAALHESIVLDENDVRYQEALLAAARASERVGRVAGVDVLRAQVGVTRGRSALVQARVDEANAREALAVQIGAPADTAFAVPETLPEPALPTTSHDALSSIAARNRPEIAEARATLAASRLGDATVDDDLRPTVALSGAVGSQVSPTSFVQSQQQIDAQNAANVASYNAEQQLFPNAILAPPTILPNVDRRRPGFWSLAVTSTFAIPIYDYGQRAAAHHAARAQIDSSVVALQNAYDSVQADVNAAERNLGSATEKLALAKDGASLATESARIAQLQYKNGLISFTDATQTEQTALSAQNDLVAARVAYVAALVRLRIALAPPDTAAAVDLGGK